MEGEEQKQETADQKNALYEQCGNYLARFNDLFKLIPKQMRDLGNPSQHGKKAKKQNISLVQLERDLIKRRERGQQKPSTNEAQEPQHTKKRPTPQPSVDPEAGSEPNLEGAADESPTTGQGKPKEGEPGKHKQKTKNKKKRKNKDKNKTLSPTEQRPPQQKHKQNEKEKERLTAPKPKKEGAGKGEKEAGGLANQSQHLSEHSKQKKKQRKKQKRKAKKTAQQQTAKEAEEK